MLLAGCGKMSIPERNGVFVDNVKKIDLKSSFAGGNSPSPEYSYLWLLFYSDKYSVGQDLTKIEYAVFIEGVESADKEYNGNGDNIYKITIHDLPSVGNLVVKMNHGVYEGGNESVSSVEILEYNYGALDKEGNRTEPSRFVVRIGLVDGRTVVIRYVGDLLHDKRI